MWKLLVQSVITKQCSVAVGLKLFSSPIRLWGFHNLKIGNDGYYGWIDASWQKKTKWLKNILFGAKNLPPQRTYYLSPKGLLPITTAEPDLVRVCGTQSRNSFWLYLRLARGGTWRGGSCQRFPEAPGLQDAYWTIEATVFNLFQHKLEKCGLCLMSILLYAKSQLCMLKGSRRILNSLQCKWICPFWTLPQLE